jgi:hypothetical protein
MPPQSSADYNLQLDNAMRDLDSLQNDTHSDCSFIYCAKDAKNENDPSVIHPKKILADLEKQNIKWCVWIIFS